MGSTCWSTTPWIPARAAWSRSSDLTVAQLEAKLAANVVAPMVLIEAVLPGMRERGRGLIVNVTSHTATADPPGPVGAGGWGVAYAASKAALHRFAPLIAVELGAQGIRAFNLDPGYVDTERQQANAEALGLVGHYVGAPPSAPAAAIAWVADHADEMDNGQTVKALKLVLDQRTPPRLAGTGRRRTEARCLPGQPADGSGGVEGRDPAGPGRALARDQPPALGEPGTGGDDVAVLDEGFAVAPRSEG